MGSGAKPRLPTILDHMKSNLYMKFYSILYPTTPLTISLHNSKYTSKKNTHRGTGPCPLPRIFFAVSFSKKWILLFFSKTNKFYFKCHGISNYQLTAFPVPPLHHTVYLMYPMR